MGAPVVKGSAGGGVFKVPVSRLRVVPGPASCSLLRRHECLLSNLRRESVFLFPFLVSARSYIEDLCARPK